MGQKLINTKEWLKGEKLKPVQLIYIIIAVFAFIFMETTMYEGLPDFVRTIIYATIIIGGVLLGVSSTNVKKLAIEMKAIFEDATMTVEEKLNAYGNLALIVLTKFGEAFELLNETQFDTLKYNKEKEELLAEIDRLQALIK